jgi:type IV pilus assembly protein PilN
MYSIDINFLNDRPEYKTAGTSLVEPKPKGDGQPPMNPIPMLIGGGVALLVNALVGGAWFVLQGQNSEAQAKLDKLTNDVQTQDSKAKEIDKINGDISQINGETQSLATVFDQIKPWSALIQDLSDRVPPGVQITNINQIDPSPTAITPAAAPSASASASASSSPGASPSPSASASASASPSPSASAIPVATGPVQTPKLEIVGSANTFDQVNDFQLLIQNSPFFNANDTRLVAATLKDNTTQIQLRDQKGASGDLPKLRPIVEYKIETTLSSKPASDLLADFKRKQADGLVVRIETLVDRGILKPKTEVKKP